MNPFRTPSERGDDDDDDEEERLGIRAPRELGPLRSSHPRRGILALMFANIYPIVDIHLRGLAFKGANDTRTEIFFDEIDALYFDIDSLLGTRIILKTLDRREIVIPANLERMKMIVETLDRKVTLPFTKIAKASLSHGEELRFGPITLELDDIVIAGRTVAWRDLLYVAAEENALVFYGSGIQSRLAWVKIRDVPHPKVLLEVLRMRTDIVIRGFDL